MWPWGGGVRGGGEGRWRQEDEDQKGGGGGGGGGRRASDDGGAGMEKRLCEHGEECDVAVKEVVYTCGQITECL